MISQVYVSLWVFYTTLLSSTYTAVGENKQAVICLLEDRFNEILLECGVEGVIKIEDHQFGSQEVTQDSAKCVPQSSDACAVRSPDMSSQLDETCMGKTKCLVPVQRVVLDNCGQTSDYLQVSFECVPDNKRDEFNIIDICGDMAAGSIVSRETGYIESPDYPEVYPPDVSCSCNLTTLTPQAAIYLQVIDIQLEHQHSENCQWDWLEYGVKGQHWGQGQKLCRPHGADVVSTGSNTIQLNFKSDGKDEQRGFWIRYQGRKTTGEYAEVSVICGQYTPSIIKEAWKCQAEEESLITVDLNCSDFGVMNILGAQLSHVQGDLDLCAQPMQTQCSGQVKNKDVLMRKCMGASTCQFNISMAPIPQCNKISNYYNIQYQCIPNVYDPSFVLDVCGRTTPYNSARRLSGFVESQNYPANYLPSTSCYCHLVTNDDATIKIKLLDIELHGHKAGQQCKEDWLEFTNPGQNWDTGRRLCDQSLGSWIHTKLNEIYINFHSNHQSEARGFWLEYSAFRQDGTAVPVRVTCGKFTGVTSRRPSTVLRDDEARATPGSNHKGRRVGLIAGLCATAAVCLLIIAILLILRYKRNQHEKLSEGAVGGAGPSSHLECPSHRHYSSVLDSTSGLPPVAAYMSSQLHASYYNPAFEGTEGIHPSTANPTA